MKRIKHSLLILAAAASLGSLALAVDSTATSTASATTEPDSPKGRFERLIKFAAHRLELTGEQSTALKEVMRLHQPELQPLMQRSRAERDELRAIAAAPTLDEIALEAQAGKIAATTKELTIASARLRADMRKILTPEQVEKIAKFRGHMAQRRHQAREGFGQWLGEY